MASVLIIDNDKLMCDWIATAVTQMEQKSIYAHTLREGFRKAKAQTFAVIFLASKMPDGSGLDIIPKIKASGYAPEIIITTGFGDPDEAELAISNGAWDYIEKPASLEAIKVQLTRVLEYKAEISTGKPPLALKREHIIGSSYRLNSQFDLISQAAQSDVNVLIKGETGTGKELFAKAIHTNSPRADSNFVIVDCTALPETLVENVLFGHARGSFTGAYTSQNGLIKQADRGTLFLDEIGELPLAMQKTFLRVIQEHRFRPVGGNQEVTSDFRLVAASNRDLESMVRKGNFREDLLFRLRSLVIDLPPLRECQEDIKELTFNYMKTLCDRWNTMPKGFSPEFWDVVTNYKWPGNVRELIHALEKALLTAKDEPILYPQHLPTYIRIHVARNGIHKKSLKHDIPGTNTTVPPKQPPTLKEIRKTVVSEAEQQYFKNLLSFAGGNIDEACRISGLSRSRLYAYLKKYQLFSFP